jgi:hypothetical protein
MFAEHYEEMEQRATRRLARQELVQQALNS